jgi:hypothetical protein
MKNSFLAFVLLLFCMQSSYGQAYKIPLDKINDYLKTFDNGYYGYLEIKDGYLYDRFKSGEHTKTAIKDLGNAKEEESSRKVVLTCKSGNQCVFSTYTNSYHEKMSFSQSSNFNTSALVTLLNNLVTALNNNSTSTLTKTESNPVTNSNNADYSTALKKLNDYLKTFDNGYYGYFEVKDGYIYIRFKAGKYNKFKMEDMEGAVIQEQYSRVIFRCKSGSCISTDWTENGKEVYTQFTKGSAYNYKELADLLNDFKDAYLGSKQTYTDQSTVSANLSREEKAKERQQSAKVTIKKDINEQDEDWDGIKQSATQISSALKEYEKQSNSKTIAAGTKVKLLNVFSKNSNYNEAKKYFGKTGTAVNTLTFSGDPYFRGKIKFSDGIEMYFDNAELEVISSKTTSPSSTSTKYLEPLKKLNEYLKTFNPGTYDRVEVKDSKVYFYFKVYTMVYNSSISISELVQNTTILEAKSVGEFGKSEIKIFCKDDKKCFHSSYSNDQVDHFRFFSNTVKDLSTMKQLLEAFVNALK